MQSVRISYAQNVQNARFETIAIKTLSYENWTHRISYFIDQALNAEMILPNSYKLDRNELKDSINLYNTEVGILPTC